MTKSPIKEEKKQSKEDLKTCFISPGSKNVKLGMGVYKVLYPVHGFNLKMRVGVYSILGAYKVLYAWLLGGVVAGMLLLLLLNSQTRGYTHVRDILTLPVHYMQSLLILPPEFPNMPNGTKYDGEDELTDMLTRRLTDFSTDRMNVWSPLCTDQTITVDDNCYDVQCNATFSASPRERVRQVLATRRVIPDSFQRAMARITARVKPHKYVVVTAISSNHYYEMQGFVHSVYSNLFPSLGSNYTLVLFDLGLTPFERYVTEKNCKCTVLDLPFDDLPEFVRHLTCYSWKPIAVSSLLPKAEYLIWNDASVRWHSSCSVHQVLERVRARGFQGISDFGSIAVRTLDSLFRFHGDQQCQYSAYTEMLGGFLMFYNDRFTREVLVKPWLSCAYDQRCMCVRSHVWQFNCPHRPPRVYGRCHRYDQSGIGVILSKLLLELRPIVYLPKGCAQIAREMGMDWFEPRKAQLVGSVLVACIAANVVLALVVVVGTARCFSEGLRA